MNADELTRFLVSNRAEMVRILTEMGLTQKK
jgi:hypothetical protein